MMRGSKAPSQAKIPTPFQTVNQYATLNQEDTYSTTTSKFEKQKKIYMGANSRVNGSMSQNLIRPNTGMSTTFSIKSGTK